MSFFEWAYKTLSDGENPSTSRLIAVVCVPAIILIPLMVWGVLSLYSLQLHEFPASVTGYTMSAATLVLGALHLNKREEIKEAVAEARTKAILETKNG